MLSMAFLLTVIFSLNVLHHLLKSKNAAENFSCATIRNIRM